MKIRYLKVIRDLTSDYTKNLMLVIAIAMGVLGVGAILGGYSVITREMTDNYMGTVPASATIEIEENLTKGLVDSVKAIAGIKEAERHATIGARMKVKGKWYPLLLFVIDDFNNMRTNKINSQSGVVDPSERTMLAERTALVMMQAKEGESVIIKTPHGEPKSIKLSGVVHDPGLAPAWQEQAGYGYISISTLKWLGESQGFDQLRILVSENEKSSDHIENQAGIVASWLDKNNYTVHEIQVPPPGRHPHQSQMNAVLTIFIVFSFLILILGSILVATSMATLMVKQVRQIGVMKTIGADSMQISSLYLFMMLILCVVALLIGIPLSRMAAAGLYGQIATLLNLEIVNRSIPVWVLILQIVAGILIPIIIAAFPVIRGSRISVRDAIDNYGVSKKSQSASALWLSQLNVISETLKLSLRNVFRQRSRLIMTLGLLAAGGAMFMTAMNVSKAWENNLKRIYVQRLYDQEIRLNNTISADTLMEQIKKIEGVKNVEGWNYAATSITNDNAYEIAHVYPDKGHGSFTMQALPVPTQLLHPTLVEGQWLNGSETNQVVLNQLARITKSNIRIGDSISLSIDGKASSWKVVGFTEDVGSPATAYVALNDFAKYTDTEGKVKMIRIAYKDRAQASAMKKNKEIETLLEKENISVNASVPVWLLHNAIAAHMKVLVNSLLAMAILMAIVGTLGLMSTISMNVMERTREIGVMRAIGATPKKIKNLVVWEGLIIGALSILVAFILSVLLSSFMGRFIGNMAFKTPLSLTISIIALAIWIVIIIAGSYIATLYPARRANKITTREALAYE
jgi:putative ABC transport system permease protein